MQQPKACNPGLDAAPTKRESTRFLEGNETQTRAEDHFFPDAALPRPGARLARVQGCERPGAE